MGDYAIRTQWAEILSWLCLHRFVQCQMCGTRNDLTKDHIVPRFMGGNNHADNIAVLCAACNHKKDRNYYSWLQPFEFPEVALDYVKATEIKVGDYLVRGKVLTIEAGQYVRLDLDTNYRIVKKAIPQLNILADKYLWKLTPQAVAVLEDECVSCT